MVVVAICVAGYLLSAPTDAAPAGWPGLAQENLPETVMFQAGDGRERPAARPLRSDYDNPERRVRASAVEALLYQDDGRVLNE
jgi:hypothetical protein